MSAGNFEACMAVVKPYEGGYVNHPKDPGGETNYGISKRAFPNLNIKNLTWTDALKIYRKSYWEPIKGELLPKGVDLVVLDPAINSGVSRGAKLLQASVAGLKVDGVIGVQTLAAVRASDPIKVIQQVSHRRLSFLQSLSTWKTFSRGWSARVAGVEIAAVKMAGATQADLRVGFVDARLAKHTQAAGSTSVVMAGGGTSYGALEHLPSWGQLGIAAAVLLTVVIMLRNYRAQGVRVEAYRKELTDAG